MVRRPKPICALAFVWLLLFGAGAIVAANDWHTLLTVRAGISLLIILLGPLLAYWLASARSAASVANAAAVVVALAAALKTYLILFEHGPTVVLVGIVECLAITGLWLFGMVSSLRKSNDA